VEASLQAPERSEHGLKKDAIGFITRRSSSTRRRTTPTAAPQAFGVAIPVVLGLGLLLLGALLMLAWRAGGHMNFFGRHTETVDPDVTAGIKRGVAAVPEEAV
jgi:hypothetical protein